MINFDFHKYMKEYIKKEDKIIYLDKAKDLKERFVVVIYPIGIS